MRKDLEENIVRILLCLKEANGWIWLRECSRRVGLHHKTVARILDRYLNLFVEQYSLEPLNLRMIRLKKEVNIPSVLRFLKIREKVK